MIEKGIVQILPAENYRVMYNKGDGFVDVVPVDFWAVMDYGDQGRVLSAIVFDSGGMPMHEDTIDHSDDFLGFLRPGQEIPQWTHDLAKKTSSKGGDHD